METKEFFMPLQDQVVKFDENELKNLCDFVAYTSFGLISDDYKVISSNNPCRAYTTDCFFAKQLYKNTKNTKLSVGSSFFNPVLKDFNFEKPKFILSGIEPNVIDLLNELEETFDIEKTLFFKTNKDDLYVLESDTKWSQTPYLISAYFSFIRVFNVIERDFKEYEILKQASQEGVDYIMSFIEDEKTDKISDRGYGIEIDAICYFYKNLRKIIDESLQSPRESHYTLVNEKDFARATCSRFVDEVHHNFGIKSFYDMVGTKEQKVA